jgi:sensor histidine kinase regulating citrate/malate metabolism
MLCSLLFNLWDNALEASAKVAQPDIRFSMREDGGYLKISIRNRVEGSVLQQNPNLRTTKQDARSHGIGMSMIRSVVSQYNGHMKLTEEEGYFVVTMMLAVDAA